MTVRDLIKELLDCPLDNTVYCGGKEITKILKEPFFAQPCNTTWIDVE